MPYWFDAHPASLNPFTSKWTKVLLHLFYHMKVLLSSFPASGSYFCTILSKDDQERTTCFVKNFTQVVKGSIWYGFLRNLTRVGSTNAIQTLLMLPNEGFSVTINKVNKFIVKLMYD